jgi:hypothetical protein
MIATLVSVPASIVAQQGRTLLNGMTRAVIKPVLTWHLEMQRVKETSCAQEEALRIATSGTVVSIAARHSWAQKNVSTQPAMQAEMTWPLEMHPVVKVWFVQGLAMTIALSVNAHSVIVVRRSLPSSSGMTSRAGPLVPICFPETHPVEEVLYVR